MNNAEYVVASGIASAAKQSPINRNYFFSGAPPVNGRLLPRQNAAPRNDIQFEKNKKPTHVRVGFCAYYDLLLTVG